MTEPRTLRARLVIGPVLLGSVLLGFAGPARADDPVLPGDPVAPAATTPAYEAISHRGQHGRHLTENGLRALRQAHAEGADRVELDVRPTSDGQLLVMHDRHLNRTTNCAGDVHRRRSTWIARHCRLDDRERVPLLGTYVAVARILGQPLMIELKAAPGWKPVVLHRLHTVLATNDYADQVVLISFSRRLLHQARRYLPEVQTSWIVGRGAPRPATVKAVASMVSIGSAYLTPAVVAAYDEAGIAVYGRVTDSPSAWARFGTLHLRGSVANNIRGLVAWKRGREVATGEPAPGPPSEEPPGDQPPADQPPAHEPPGDRPHEPGGEPDPV